MDFEVEMANRVRRHLLITLGGVAFAVALMVSAGFIARASGAATGPILVLPMLGVLLIPAIGFWSTWRNLRCPSCNRFVAFQVSWYTSPFTAGMGTGQCRGCGQKIFGDVLRGRARRMFFVMFGLGVAIGALAVIGNLLIH